MPATLGEEIHGKSVEIITIIVIIIYGNQQQPSAAEC